MVLIHWKKSQLQPVGGPSGYLYNLNCGFALNHIDGYSFLPDAKESHFRGSLKRIMPQWVKDRYLLSKCLSMPNSLPGSAVADYSEYEALHFHSTESMFCSRGGLDGYSGKVILTSHTPCAQHKELISLLNTNDARKYESKLRDLAIIDKYSFERADYIIFPCREAEEPYFHTWKEYETIRDESKIRYVPTGILPAKAQVSRKEVRLRYGIPFDAFLGCYVGRHTSIKGYDVLKEQAHSLVKNTSDWFLVAGREGPLFGYEHPRWVEAGWTNDPHSLISAADYFILPNRETYFDLVLLEVLSLGKIVIASRTGGNKFFEQYKCPGIFFYESPSEMMDLIRFIKETDADKRTAWGNANRALFDSEFTVDMFSRRYDRTVKDLLGA